MAAVFLKRNFIFFILLSAVLHLWSLAVNFYGPAEPVTARAVGISYVSRSAERFQPYIAAVLDREERVESSRTATHNSLPKKQAEQVRKVVPDVNAVKPQVTTSPRQDNSRQAPAVSSPPSKRAPVRREEEEEASTSAAHEAAISMEAMPSASAIIPSPTASVVTQQQALSDALIFHGKQHNLGQQQEENAVSGEVGFTEAQPRYERNPAPVYPEIARRRGWQGTVQFKVLVRADGRVGELEIIESSGYRALDNVARKTIHRWLFQPATRWGVPVASQVVVPIDFVLEERR